MTTILACFTWCNLKKQSQFIRAECRVLRIAYRNLKKQSQFDMCENCRMPSNNKDIRQYCAVLEATKTKPIQSHLQMLDQAQNGFPPSRE